MSVKVSEFKFRFATKKFYARLCGIHDRFIPEYEKLLGVYIIPRGQSFIIQKFAEKDRGRIELFFARLEEFVRNLEVETELDEFDIRNIYRDSFHDKAVPGEAGPVGEPESLVGEKSATAGESPEPPLNSYRIFTTFSGRPISPKTRNQKRFVDSCRDRSITFAIGPAGTGKTYLSVVLACAALQAGEVERIILTRPAVEAGENLGFLPGDMAQKIDPYLRPLYDFLYECLGFEKAQALMASNQIEVAPLAFMRGRTLSRAWIILDEAQNCTYSQLKMFLTRLGKGSTMVISGDITQTDLKFGHSGLTRVTEKLRFLENDVGQIFYDHRDITRHSLVEKIVNALTDED